MSVFITFVPSRFQAESFYFKLIIIFNKSLSHVVVKKHTFLNFYVKGTPILFANQVGGKKLKLFLNEQLLCWFNLETLSHRCSNSPVSCIRFNYASHIVVDWYNDAKKKIYSLKVSVSIWDHIPKSVYFPACEENYCCYSTLWLFCETLTEGREWHTERKCH